MSKNFDQPHEISDVKVAFPGSVRDLMPDVPDEFAGRNQWVQWQRDWFFSGLKRLPIAKDGIDVMKAMRHLLTIQSSFEPKHERKEEAVAYLASLWFTSPDGEVLGTTPT